MPSDPIPKYNQLGQNGHLTQGQSIHMLKRETYILTQSNR